MTLMAELTTRPTTRLAGSVVAKDSRGLLLLGASGSGKSSLALQLIDRGYSLVADDAVEIHAKQGQLWARAPRATFGLLEVYGVGLVRMPAVESVALSLVAQLAPAAEIERLPTPERYRLAGIELPQLLCHAWAASTALSLDLAHRLVSKPEEMEAGFLR